MLHLSLFILFFFLLLFFVFFPLHIPSNFMGIKHSIKNMVNDGDELSWWVVQAKPYLQAGAFEIVDDRIKGNFDVESMRRAAQIASMCVERDAAQRPVMAEVLAELKEAYSIQLSYLASSDHMN